MARPTKKIKILLVREKAFKNGFYGIDKQGNINYYRVEHYVPDLEQIHTQGVSIDRELRFKLKDYGKTWALTKKELEKERK